MNDIAPAKSLLLRSKELSDNINRIVDRAENEELVRQMEKIQEPLERHVAAIVDLHKSLSMMQKAKLVKLNPVNASTVKPLQDRISKLRKVLNGNRSQIASGNVWAECNTHSEARAKELGQQLQTQWNDFVIAHTPGIETFRPFAQLPSCKTTFEALLKLDLEAKNDQTRLPSDDTEVQVVRTRGKTMQELIGRLGLEGEPPVMQEFLKRCANDGVPLDELSDEILEWLKSKRFATSLRIVTS
jgi:hypothetical protein